MKVKVLRALCIKAERKDVGAVVDLPEHLAREAIWMGKAELAVDAPAAKPAPMTAKSTPALAGVDKKAGE